MASISGTVYENSPLTEFVALAYNSTTYALAGSADVISGAFTITGLSSGNYYVVVRPKIGRVWSSYTLKYSNDVVFPTSPESVPYLFQGKNIVSGDPYFSSVESLLRFEGANNGTTFTDDKGLTVASYGTVKISTSNFKQGASSGYFDGSVGHLIFTKGADWYWPSATFTFECWAYPTANGGYLWSNAYASDESSGWYWRFYINSSGYLSLYSWTGGNNTRESTNYPLTLNSWNHIAYVVISQVVYIYSNGNLCLTVSGIPPSGNYSYVLTGSYFTGYIDELRVTKGVARYTSEFTPPAAPFPPATGQSTGLAEPVWPLDLDSTVLDGDVTWTNIGRLTRPVVHGPLQAV